MKKKLLVVGGWLLVCLSLKAHPGIGIVKDSKGNIFYTDLKQVWKISPDEKKVVVVPGVHTHELYIDEHDNLYGEHLWYNGESKNTWGHYTWCLKNTGELVKDLPEEGFLSNYSFARDSFGNMYWVERFSTSKIMKKNNAGEVTKLIEHKFGFIGWLTCTKDGTLYFTESNKLHRLRARGSLETLTNDLGSRSADFSVMGHNYDSYGIWADDTGNVYIAMIDSKKVIRIDRNGKKETVLSTNSLWTICSGLFDNDGNMWVLENSLSNNVRARKITKEVLTVANIQNDLPGKTHLPITIFTAFSIVILFFVARSIIVKMSNTVHFAL